MLGNSVILSSETSMSGNFLSCIKGVKYHFEFPIGTWDFSRDATVGKFLIWRLRGTLVHFHELRHDSRVTTGKSRSLSWCPREVQSPLVLQGGDMDCFRVTAVQIDLIYTCVHKLRVPFQWLQGSQGCIQGSPGDSGIISS